ncbi:hypothetical protein M8J77_022751 [Diaphorina citri]|nr:hypothetical protein M8J77_022751 [Diaphorina citri]
MPNSSFFSTVSNKTGNSTDLDIQFDSNFAFLMFSLILAMTWVLYITYYNSRVVGYFITRLLTRFYVKKGYLSIGSFTVCALSGKIMFRDIVYITDDYTVRIQDGWLIFRWWRAYVPKDVSEDLSHSDTRLSVMLNGYELHIYNRCKVYSRLEQVFGLDPVIIPPNEMEPEDDLVEKEEPPSLGKSWRDLIPVIKVDVSSGRVVFGNRLVPTTLSINVEEAHFMYSTKPAASKLDHFMHFVKCKAENFKVILAPSPKYMGISDEPPRFMGAGFVVLSSNNMDLYFYMDEPGLVPREPHMLELANGEMVESAAPMWGVDIKCGKGTDFSYGPWADRQREHLFKFFFPQDCQTMVPTPAPQPGERRSVQSFDVRLSTLHESTIDLLFSKNKETNAVHVNVGQGSYLEMTLPWIIGSDGYTTKVTGQLLHFEATTSLTFRSLVESETLEFAIRSHYPLRWNDHQEWLLNLTGCKASGYFIYAHKDFFQDMINDWSTKSKPDLLHFVPYTWRLTVLLKEFELITLANESNWIDCSSQHQENSHIAICGDLFDFSFDLPFDDFLPATLPLRFWIQGESVDLALFLPEVYSSRLVVESIDRHAKLQARDGTILHPRPQDNARKWRNICKRSGGWIDCWSIPIAAISINWIYHPMPAFGPPPQADITTPEKEEILLSPMRIPRSRKATGFTWPQDGNPKFDPTTLPADKVSLELEIGPSVMYLYGSWLRNFYFLKESIFGEDQQFTDMNSTTTPRDSATAASNPTNAKPNHTTSAPADSNIDTSCGEDEISLKKEFDPRVYRPLDVIVSITMHDIQAHLMKNCTDNDPACPVILIERFGFEMKKSYKETLLQLLLSPAILITTDRVLNRTSKDKHLQQGHLMLSGLQIRGHAMFSDTGRSLDQETLEYAWQLEIQLGKLSGKFTSPQLYHVITGLETLVLLITDPESKLQAPRLPPECHHGIPPLTCPESDADGKYRCPSGDDIKYRMTRVCIDAIDLYLIESGTALNLWASPLRLATCNLHGNHVKAGVTAVLPAVRLRQLICAGQQQQAGVTAVLPAVRLRQLICAGQQQQATNSSAGGGVGGGVNTSGGGGGGSSSNTNTSGSNRSQTRGNDVNDLWLEIASISGGPLMLESVSSMCETDKSLHLVQAKYLKMHDERYKRLWFLWPSDSKSLVTGKCGCVGGCVFFGRNRNGQRFFKPSRQDLADGVNIAAYKINDSKDPGFGQSILHESQLVFHTPPYNAPDVAIHDYPPPSWGDNKPPPPPPSAPPPNQLTGESYLGREMTGSTGDSTASPSPASSVERRPTLPRRFSYNNASLRTINGVPYARLIDSSPTEPTLPRRFSYNNASLRTINGVPYARLIDSSPTGTLPHRLDSDSRLHTARSILSVPESNEAGLPPKSSVSDSRLAVDYFVAPAPNLGTGTDDIPAASESEQSLYNSGGEVTGALPPYPRTVSLCSENQSDVFFSAEEELSHQLASTASATDHPSRSGSLKLSLSNPTASKKRFGSDMNILANSAEAVPSSATIGNLELGATRQPLYRSDHEIHTPEHRDEMRLLEDTPLTAPPRIPDLGSEDWHHHRGSLLSNVMPRSVSPRLLASSLNGLAEADPLLMDSSDSISSTSFISAVSSQEDLALVNLHMQVNKPIIDSPLLMATYINHLSQISCSNWTQVSLPAGSDAFTVPLFQRSSDGRLVFIGSKYLPKFDTITEGFTCLKMVTRSSPGMGTNKDKEASSATRTPTCAYPWDSQVEHCVKKLEEIEASSKQGPQEELLSMRNECGTKTTVVVKMKGDIDIFITPLSLESLQRFIDALTPTLASVHPLTVLNHLHMSCIGVVEAANVLKRDQYLSQLQGGGSKRSTAERKSKPGDQVPCHTYEETIASQVQGSIVLPKINIAVLQVSVVEEVIAFSALDNIRDLTCVSFLAICLEGITTRFHIGKESREIVQTFHRPTVTPSGKKNNVFKAAHKAFLLGHSSSNNTGQDNKVGEPVYIETSERTQEETVITLHVSRLHMQLRRLQNQSSLLQEAVITAIPLHCSRAMFSVTKPTSSTEPTNIHQTSSTTPKPNPGTPNSTKSTAANTTKPNTTATTTSKSNSAGITSVTTKPNDTTTTTSKPTSAAVVSAKPNTTVVTSSKPSVSGSAGKPNSSSTSGTTATKPNSSGSTTANTTGKPNTGSSSAANTTNKANSGSSSAAHSTAKPNSNVSGGSAVSGSGEAGGTSGCQEKEDSWATLSEDKMGFIMMECGLEGVSFKVVKRSKFEREEDSNDSKDKTEIVAETTGDSKIVRDDVSSETINISHVKPEEVTSSSTPKGSRTSAPAPGANGTGNGDTTDSTTQPTPGGDTSKALVPLIDANASSCVIDVKSVWFNFAAPPRTPITRSKIAYTRLDWNLLSTASPGITAWMNPSNRCVIRGVHALRCRYRRSTAVVTCLMSQALDESSVHMPVKSRYGRFTPMAKTLQEDPSCQLCNILKKYLLKSTTGIEANLKEPDLPHLSTLRQGVIVLSRQWKNILYTPLLLEHNFKIKNHPMKPMNVTFAIPDPEEVPSGVYHLLNERRATQIKSTLDSVRHRFYPRPCKYSSCTTVRLDTYKQTGICSSGRRSLASEEEDEVVVLVGEDVDLLVILIGTRSPSNVYFLKPGRGKVVPVLYHPQTTIDTSLAEHILFIRAISGCDSTSALFNQGKVKALRTVVKNPDLLPYIRRFLDPASTTREITEAGERFLVVLYGGNHETTSLNKLRYKSYVTSAFKVTSNIAALPPTESAASQHALRTFYQVQQWLGKNVPTTEWGWKQVGNTLIPITTLKSPAPDSLLSLVCMFLQEGVFKELRVPARWSLLFEALR